MTRQILVAGTMFGVIACGSPANPTAPAPAATSAPAATAGTAHTGGTVSTAAVRPASRPAPEPMWEMRGIVARLSGTCPRITFLFGGTVVVHATDSTEFIGLECRTIANGDYVKVIGTRQRNGSIVARAIGK